MNRTNIAILLGFAAMLIPFALPSRVKTQHQRWIDLVKQADAPMFSTNGLADIHLSHRNLSRIDLSGAPEPVRIAHREYLNALADRIAIHSATNGISPRAAAENEERCLAARRLLLRHLNNGLGKPF